MVGNWGHNGRNSTDFTQLSLSHCPAVCPNLRWGGIRLALDRPIDRVETAVKAAPYAALEAASASICRRCSAQMFPDFSGHVTAPTATAFCPKALSRSNPRRGSFCNSFSLPSSSFVFGPAYRPKGYGPVIPAEVLNLRLEAGATCPAPGTCFRPDPSVGLTPTAVRY